MPLAKCARCEKLYDKSQLMVCAACLPAEEADYEAVRSCLKDNPEMTAETVSEATGVELACVMRMIEQGVVLNSATVAPARCGRCGALAISATKKLCNRCLEELNREVAKQRHIAQSRPRKEVKFGEHPGVRESIEIKRT